MNLQSASMLSNAERTRRSSNFTIKEVKYLIQLVDSRKDVIESKKSDRAASEEKVKAWMEIEEEFNACFDDYRSFRVLKTKYDNLKKDIRRKYASSNLSNLTVLKIMKSSENPVTNEPLSDLDIDLSEEEKTIESTSNASEVEMKPTLPLNEAEIDAAAEEYVFETFLFGDAQPSQKVEKNSAPKIPEERPEKPQKKKNPSVDVWEEVAHKKLKKIALEIKVIEEEWALRKQKLQLEVENLRIENRLKEEQLKRQLENNNNK